MKKILYLLIALLPIATTVYSQAPGIFNYQGVARNSVGNVLENKTITLRLSIHDISSAGPVVYQESRTVTTNPFGLFNIQVGSTGANNVTGSITTVNWAIGNKYLKVEIDPAGGNSFINLGTSQLASVPYALNALGAAPIGPAGGDLSGTYPNPSVTKIRGINLSTATPSVNSVLGFDGNSWGPVTLANQWLSNGNHIYNSNTGNVGIGTTNPLVKLHIERGMEALRLSGIHTGMTFYTGNDLKAFLGLTGSHLDLGLPGDNTNGELSFSTRGLPRIVIQSGGNVGIGINNPLYPLHIRNTNPSNLVNLQGINPGIVFSDYTSGTFKNEIRTFGNNLEFTNFISNGNIALFANKVGVGTNIPAAKLHVVSNDEALRLSGNDSYMSFYDGNSYKGFLGATDNDIELGTPNSNTNGKVVFYRKGRPLLTLEANTDSPTSDLVKIGAVGAYRFSGAGLPKLSIQGGSLSFKKPDGDQMGEWAIGYGADDNMGVYFNGGIKGFFANTSGAYVPLSDFRIKENFESYKAVLKDVRKLNVLTYTNKSDKTGERIFGLVAQNIKQYFPELVASSGGTDNFFGIDYSKIGVLAIKAIQEQQVIIETLEKKIEMLEKRLAMLESKLK